ncbi:receptor-like protein kinase [Gossypium australe]|uniref:Receptor-like protein kinase n=1 Tax=Gossypium australe TaxID=47621 RepID=A0A5B6VAM3_9ROSI|nr:receptor-like protein kinase [Gossypium australe]
MSFKLSDCMMCRCLLFRIGIKISYEIIERISLVTYRLALPSGLKKIHNFFHVLMLRQYRSDFSYVITFDEIEIKHDLLYSEEAVKILALEIKKNFGINEFH